MQEQTAILSDEQEYARRRLNQERIQNGQGYVGKTGYAKMIRDQRTDPEARELLGRIERGEYG